jgi:hypothetical protein
MAARLHGTHVDGALRVASVVVTVLFVALLCFVPPSENDFWLQAKIGQIIVETGQIPRTVLFPFSWASEHPFNAHEWLPSIVFHFLDSALGRDRLVFVQGALGLTQFGLCAVLARKLSGSLAIGLLLAAVAMLNANYRYHLRPEIFALLLMVGLLAVLSAYQHTGRAAILCWSFPIAVLWANTHGSFILGPIIAGLFAAGEGLERIRTDQCESKREWLRGGSWAAAPYAFVAIGMLLSSLANPLGADLLRFVFELSVSEVTRTFILEWAPTLSPVFLGKAASFIFGAVLAATGLVMFLARRHLRVTDLLLIGAFFYLAFQGTRFVALFGFVALVVCGRLLGRWSVRLPSEHARQIAVLALASIGVGVVFLYGNARGGFPYTTPSSGLTEPMVAQLSRPIMKGNVFNSYELGAELIYRAYPRLKPSIDSRIDSYGDRYFLLQMELLAREQLLNDFVAEYDIRYMLLLWRDFNQIKDMAMITQHWRMKFADHKAVLLQRRDVRD